MASLEQWTEWREEYFHLLPGFFIISKRKKKHQTAPKFTPILHLLN